MADLFDFWNGSTPSSFTGLIDTGGTDMPDWKADASRALLGTAVDIAEQEYAPYGGARISGLDPLSQQAQTLGQQNVGMWKPGVDYAAQTAPTQVQNYLNPYQNQVVDRIAQLGQRNLSENLLPQVNTTFTGAGQFGSTRNADFTNRALRDANESILGAQGQLLNQGFQQAMQNYMTDATRMANVASMGANLGAADVGLLDTMGQMNRGLAQQNLDLNYQNFLEQREQPKQSLSWLSSIIQGLPVNTQTYQSTMGLPQQQPATSPLLQAAQAFSGVKALTSPTVQQQSTQQTSAYR